MKLHASPKAEAVASAWRTILSQLGYPLDDPHFADTPDRVARFLIDWHTVDKEPPKLTVFPNTEHYDQIVLVDGLTYHSMCAHHGVPFSGKASIAYIPKRDVLGLSKFARVLDHFSHRFTTQERITQQVALHLNAKLSPVGVAVVLEGEHLCMSMRGVQKPAHATTTSALLGAFRKKAEARAELMALLKRSR